MPTKRLLRPEKQKGPTQTLKQVFNPQQMKGHKFLCEALKLIHEVNTAEGHKTVAKEAKADAKKYNCGWAK